ncbi:flagellar basal body-associated FliL family protein [Ideonella sp. A 288]|uniref:flagellar basal body-associated FliL family protein n=1 Tax=Ideonella sp. A 288 TaxID=1962181 RepID=UPI000B4C04EA|nr:flagellar basal body-associated FliL family protein [Ideonella sp. A 288]
MSAAAAEVAEAPPKGGGKKKLIIIIAAVLLLVLVGGGAAFFMMKKKAAAAEDGEEGDGHAPAAAAHAPKHEVKPGTPPVFVPLDPFTVNLADKETERYAQVGITLEIDDAKTGDTLKAYMPAIRNNILMLLSHKTAAELLSREGKLKLAKEIRREALMPLGIEVEDEEDEEAAPAEEPPKKKKKKKKAPASYPVKAAHFSNIIIQ